MITQFVSNTVLYNMCLSWIISSKKQRKYVIEENHSNWLDKGPWYNKAIYSKSHETVFGDIIRDSRTDR